MPTVQRKSTSRSFCEPIYRLVYLPCRIIQAISDLAKKIFYYIRYGKSHPFERTAEEQQHFRELVASLTHSEAPQVRPVLSSSNFHATWEDAGKKMPLTDNTKHSKEMKEFRVLAKQVITSLAKAIVSKKMIVPTLEADRNDIISGVGMLCDKITERLATKLEKPNLAAKLFDGLLTVANEEAKAHVAANLANPVAKGEKTYQSELNEIEAKQKDIANYITNPQPALEGKYREAVKYLLEKAKDGSEFYRREHYYDTYVAAKDEDSDHKKAHVAAVNAYEIQARLHDVYFAKYAEALDATHNPSAAHETAVTAYEEQAKQLGINYVKLTENFHDQCLQIYLQNCYAKIFINQKACSNDVKRLFEKMEKCEHIGEAQQIYRDYVHILARNLLHRLMPIIVETIAVPLITTNFFKWLVKSTVGIEIKDGWEKTIEKLIKIFTSNPQTITKLVALKYPIEDKLIGILEKWIISKELTHQFGSNIYPAIQNQILKMICRTIIQDKIKELAPLLYAYQATEKPDQDKHADDIKKALWKELTSDARKEFSLKGDNPPYTQDAFYVIVDELLEQMHKDQFLARKVIREFNLNENVAFAEHFRKLLVASQDQKATERGTIKTFITLASGNAYNNLVRPAEADPDKKAITAKLEKTYGNDLGPLVERIENSLLDRQSKTPKVALTPEAISEAIKSVVNDEPMEITSFIGELTVNIIFKFANAESWLTWGLNRITPATNYIQGKINYHASASLEPFRASFDELAKTVKETLEAKLIDSAALMANPKDKDKVGLDIKKVYELYEGKGERKLNCDPELELLAKQLFEMVIMISSSMYLGNAVVTKTIGTDSTHIKNVLSKVHRTFFGIQMINLARLDRVFHVMTSILDPQPVPHAPLVPGTPNAPPAVPSTPAKS